jgi:hypothetical protein
MARKSSGRGEAPARTAEQQSATRELKRVRYFAGQLLGAADFEAEQDYLRERMRLNNRCLHGWGVACGLEVAPPGADDPPLRVSVSPGLALDEQGDEIRVAETVCLDLVFPTGGVREPRLIAIRYAEFPSDPVPIAGRGEEAVEFSRIREGYEIATFPPATSTQPLPPGWLILARVSPPRGPAQRLARRHISYAPRRRLRRD